MALIERVQAILFKPRATWPVIAAEPADLASIYSRYLVFLAAIPAVAGFIGLTLVGIGAFGVNYRLPVMTGLLQMVVGYVMALVVVFVMSLIVNALAPTFGGTRDSVAALKLVAYASTAGFVAGIFSLLPSLSILGLVGAIYSVVLIYIGLPILMRCPPAKATAYTAVVVVCGIVAALVIGAISALFSPMGRSGALGQIGQMGQGAPEVTIRTPDGAVTLNPTVIAEAGKRMEEAGKRMEAAQKSGDGAAAGKALGEMMGAIGGTGGTPIAAADLKAMLPESIGNLKRESIEAKGGGAMGLAGSTAEARYVAGDRNVQLSIVDMGGLGGLAAMAGWANMTVDKETASDIEKVYKDGGRTVREDYRKDGSHGEYSVILSNGVMVEASGDQVDMPTLKGLVTGIDFGKLEALKRSAK